MIRLLSFQVVYKNNNYFNDDARYFPYFHVTLRVNMINSTSSNTRKASIVARPFPRVAGGAWSGDETNDRLDDSMILHSGKGRTTWYAST